MDEKEVLQQIQKSADDVEIPESLRPENMEKKLKEHQRMEQQATKQAVFVKKVNRYAQLAAAACVLILGGYAFDQTRNNKNTSGSREDSEIMMEMDEAGEAYELYELAGEYTKEASNAMADNAGNLTVEEKSAATHRKEDVTVVESFGYTVTEEVQEGCKVVHIVIYDCKDPKYPEFLEERTEAGTLKRYEVKDHTLYVYLVADTADCITVELADPLVWDPAI